MTEKRKAEIGLVLYLERLYSEGITIGKPLKRKIGDVSKETGISKEELVEFAEYAACYIMARTTRNAPVLDLNVNTEA